MGKLIVDLDDHLHKALRLVCLRENCTIKDKITALLKETVFAEQGVAVDEALARELDQIKMAMQQGDYTTLDEYEKKRPRPTGLPQAQRRAR